MEHAEVAGLLHLRPGDVAGISDLTRPWTTATRTLLVTLADGEQVVVQRGAATRAGRAAMARRIRLARSLRSSAQWLAVPAVLGGDPAAPGGPWVATRFVEGRPGNELLASDAEAARLGTLAGRAAAEVARVSPSGLRLPRAWSEPALLAAASAAWLRSVEADLGALAARRVRAVAARIPALLAASPPAVAHGDLAPVNLIVEDGRIAGLLDLERMRLAPAAFDAAWFRCLVRLHHPERSAAVGQALLAARGLPDDAPTFGLLDDLAVLACLELAAGSPSRSAGRDTWVARLEDLASG